MKHLKFVLILLPVLFLGGCEFSSPQIKAIFSHMVTTLVFILPLVAVTIALIFLLNRITRDKKGCTNNTICSIIGALVITSLFVFAFYWKFGFGWIPTSISIVLGLTLGIFSYTLDELLVEFWENKEVTIPGLIGIVWGGWLFTLMFTSVWLEGNMYITHKACASRVIIERYTYHYSTDSKGNDNSYHSWDYHSHTDRVVLGEVLPVLVEGRDYTLGTGASFRKDRVGRTESYYWIGGYLFSEKKDKWNSFVWLQLFSTKQDFEIGKVQTVCSNFYGNPIKSKGVLSSYKTPLPAMQDSVRLPDDLPSPTIYGKVFSYGFNFFRVLLSEQEYRSFLYLIGSVFLIAGLLAIFPPLRFSVLVFFICSSIVILIILLIVAARTGSLAELVSSTRKTGGGGGFGGRSFSA